MKVLIADDHIAIRIGLKHILKHEYPKCQFAEASDSKEVVHLAEKTKFDLIILDINMPGRNGLDTLKHLRNVGHNVPILIFSFHQEDQVAIRALKYGASGFLSKDAPDNDILKAVGIVMSGRKFISISVAEQMAAQLNNRDDLEPHEHLSNRELQTMVLIASGKTVSEIAEELSLGVPTISTYRSRIMEKMRMKNNAELTRYAIEKKLI